MANLKDGAQRAGPGGRRDRRQILFWTRGGLVGFQKKEVTLGMSNNTRIEIKSGLAEGDEVLLNPRAVIGEAPRRFSRKRRSTLKRNSATINRPRFPKPTPRLTPPNARAGPPNTDFKALDKDGDGKPTEEDEAPPQMKPFFGHLDTNGDGSVTAAELAEARKKMREAGGGPGGPGGP